MAAVFSPAYTEAQLEEVRKALRHQLRELGADSVISQLVSELQSHSGPDTQPVRPDQALQVLQVRDHGLRHPQTAPGPCTQALLRQGLPV